MNDLDVKIIYYIYKVGPAFIRKLAARLNQDQSNVKRRVTYLQKRKYLQRVEGRTVEYRTGKNTKVVKHRNHTYYELTKRGEHYIRKNNIRLDINLRPPYKQA